VEGFGDASAGIVVQSGAPLPEVLLDRARVRLLLRNLLDNALRHGAGAPVTLTLAATGDGGIVLAVRDHGPGVEEAQLSQLAQPFWRADSARGRSTGGVGLGLYLCRLVAEAHGAQWTVRNAGPGLEVRVAWPAA
jgi:signal transduction histidine kinase